MKFVLGLAAALAFAAVGTISTGAMAQGNKPAIESGSNATDTKGASGGKMSGGKMAPKKGAKKKQM